MTKGAVCMPQHCSDCLLNSAIVLSDDEEKIGVPPQKKSRRIEQQIVLVAVHCNRPGVAWKGLFPLLFESPKHISNMVARILTKRFWPGRIRMQESPHTSDFDLSSTTHHRRSGVKLIGCNLLYIVPPMKTNVDYYFSGKLIHYEHIWLQMQTLSAYYATLGGGYFLCRRLTTAIQLARRQRQVATWMGDVGMADRCTLNEAYNYLHAGQFDVAFAMLKRLKASARARNDVVLYKMCKSGRLLGKRMKRAGKRGGAESNIDDYQRIRIVEKL